LPPSFSARLRGPASYTATDWSGKSAQFAVFAKRAGNFTPIDSQAACMTVLPEGHPEIAIGKIGVLLVNLGTPDGTDYWSMRRYLSEFLSDRRVIEISPLKWQPLLQGIILMTRPGRSGKAYKAIWNKKRDESPLRTTTRSQAEKLATGLSVEDERIIVDWAMRYGTPAIGAKLDALKVQGCERILIAPLYPQYAAATTASVNDKAFDALKTMRWQPAIRTLPPYFDEPAHIDALARSYRDHIDGLGWQPEKLLLSYHGLPQDYFDRGDPYHCHCQKTTRLLREELKCGEDFLLMAFQSRFGRAEWIKPYTDETLKELAENGVKRLAVMTPGFAADCVETLEEIAIAGRELFAAHGGERFSLVPCLNDGEPGMDMLKSLIMKELSGWF
jgi:ferrochelatase